MSAGKGFQVVHSQVFSFETGHFWSV